MRGPAAEFCHSSYTSQKITSGKLRYPAAKDFTTGIKITIIKSKVFQQKPHNIKSSKHRF